MPLLIPARLRIVGVIGLLLATFGTQKLARHKGYELKREKFAEFCKRESFLVVADIRALGMSPKTPYGQIYTWYKPALAELFKAHKITYLDLAVLGAPREIRSDEREIFRLNYLKHISKAKGQFAIEELVDHLHNSNRVLVFCAERKYTDCHREFLADYIHSTYAIPIKHY